jgi:hypothetical protein
MAYEMRFYCRRAGDTSAVAETLQAGVLARYPGAVFRPHGRQVSICEFDIEAPTGATIYVFADVESARVATAVSEVDGAPAGLRDTAMIATVVVSGADDALLMACATTFVVDFDGVLWDEMDGFDVSLS